MKENKNDKGFTLIELSIVLVIIGLIVGGVLVGQDLIRSAYIRAQISQIEKFNTATNTFYGKYQALPGDMNLQTAQQYGFSTSVHNAAGGYGEGDGNGIIDGNQSGGDLPGFLWTNAPNTSSTCGGETGVFWADLSSATAGNLIEGGFNHATETPPASCSFVIGTMVDLFLPTAKLGGGNYVYVTSINGLNYYGIEMITRITNFIWGSAGMTVSQAYNIDKKIDDGYPTTGRVAAVFAPGGYAYWVVGGGSSAHSTYYPANSAFSGIVSLVGDTPGPITCFDAATVGGTTNYSMEINHGAGLNCALIFQFQ